MDLGDVDWARLGELRERFLATDAGARSAAAIAWSSRRDLEIYDATFAQRIGWKWRAVLREIELRDALPPLHPKGVLLDWGCGTGIASRAWLAAFGERSVTRVEVFDRAPEAQDFAAEKLREEHPALDVRAAAPRLDAAPDLLLLSHVLGELDDADLDELLALVRASGFVVWVEPGSHAISRRLSAVRERVRSELEVVAPCTHQAGCGMLIPGMDRHWCHHFAAPPPEAFTSRHWALFSKRLGIDLRALPYSFLVLRREVARTSDPALSRILGRPRQGKGHALVDLCTEAGVRELRLLQRTAPELLRRWKKGAEELPLYRCQVEGGRITGIEAALKSGGPLRADARARSGNDGEPILPA